MAPQRISHGIPISLKDLFETAGIATSAGAGFLKDYVPDSDAEVPRRLSDAGAVLMGKANMNKFAGGESGDNPDFGKINDEATVLQVAHGFQQATEWHHRHPPI